MNHNTIHFNTKSVDETFKERVRFIIESPFSSKAQNRTGIATIRNPVLPEAVFDLREGFPLLGLKKTSLKNIFHELMFFIKGETNIKYLVDNKCNIWNGNAYDYYLRIIRENKAQKTHKQLTMEEFLAQLGDPTELDSISSPEKTYYYGDLGEVYGAQWRNWDYDVDQLKNAIDMIKNNPTSRRIMVSAWNPSELEYMALPPCHYSFQFLVMGDNLDELCLRFNMRSNDYILGAPYNIASYALLLEMVAKLTWKKATFLIMNVGDAHIYENHLEGAAEVLERKCTTMPVLYLDRPRSGNIEHYKYNMLDLRGYNPHPSIKLEMAV